VDNRAEIREFLTTRRARITPGQAGLPGRRRDAVTRAMQLDEAERIHLFDLARD
jgi:hypothetical protein